MAVPFDKNYQPVLGNRNPNRPDAHAPLALCISGGDTQYLFASDEDPGRIYKMTLDGEMLGYLGESGRGPGQFNWIHSLDCSQLDDGILWVADMNNWRIQKLIVDID